MSRKQLTLLSLLALVVCAGIAQADIVAFKRSPELTMGNGLDTVFQTAITNGTITVYSGPTAVYDADLYLGTYSLNARWLNYGAGGTIREGAPLLIKFDVTSLPGFAGCKINKAVMRMYYISGNTGFNWTGYVTTKDWAEGTKNGAYPGAAPAAPGVSGAHPMGLNTGANQNASGGTTAPLYSWGGDSLFSTSKDASGVTVGRTTSQFTGSWPDGTSYTYDAFIMMDVTSFVQLFANGTPNYGFCCWHNDNYNTINCRLSETTMPADAQPTLFVDYTPNVKPERIADLAIEGMDWYKLDLTWTAPNDLPLNSAPASYDIRYSTSPIDDTNWDAATQVAGEPVPAAPGTAERFMVTGLDPLTTYWFAIKSIDASGLVSDLSTVVSATTYPPEAYAPDTITDLAVTATKPNYVKLSWTAPADNGSDPASGLAAGYELRYSTSPIDSGNFASAALVTTLPPNVAGTLETIKISGLTPLTTYYFAIRTRDEVPNWSGLSNVPSTTTLEPDPYAPSAITDLMVSALHVKAVMLAWTTPADNGSAGCASYDVRYSTSPVDASNFDAAMQVPGAPLPGTPGTTDRFLVTGLTANTTYYFAIKTIDFAEPANVSPISNTVSGTTLPPVTPLTIQNPWITNDRVADCRTLQTMAATFVNNYTPDGVIAPADSQAKVINIYNNQKRRMYHWADLPPSTDDAVRNLNVFGWGLCGNHKALACTINNAAGFTVRQIDIPNTHWVYEVSYDNAWHILDTMTTMYVFNRQGKIASCAEIAADGTILTSAPAEGRACPGFLLCGDPASTYANWMKVISAGGSNSGIVTPGWSMNMNLRMDETFTRTWENWTNQHPTAKTYNPPDPPFHHEGWGDYKDTVNIRYWEPYKKAMTSTGAGTMPTYRRWANGTHDIRPDFTNTGWRALLEPSSSGLAAVADDGIKPDLHAAAAGTPGVAIFKITVPYYITDANISGDFYRKDATSNVKIHTSLNGTTWTQTWGTSTDGTTTLSNYNLRGTVFGQTTWWVKIEINAAGNKANAGISSLLISTIFEHNKGALAYLDKGVNNITVTFDNPQDLAGAVGAFKVTYKWKEYDPATSDWTVDRIQEQYITTSPSTFTINVGGAKVPRTEYVLMQVTEPPMPDPIPPHAIDDLAVVGHDWNKITLGWTAVGDDDVNGSATAYDIRYAAEPILTKADFAAATPVVNPPTPMAAGTHETFVVTGLQPLTTYYFAVRARDEGGNVGEMGNTVPGTTDNIDTTPPAPVYSLIGRRGKTASSVELTWKATGDDDRVGTATTYDLRYSTSPIDETNWASATQIAGEPVSAAAGTKETFTVTGLTGGTQYYFAMKVADERPNGSGLSNCAPAVASALGEVSFQRGQPNSVIQDTYMVGLSASNYGTTQWVRVCGFQGMYGTAGIQRGLFRFNLSTIPAATQIVSARLCLYTYNKPQIKNDVNNGIGSYAVHRLTRNFSETVANWTTAASGVTWTTPGGDFDAAPEVTVPRHSVADVGWYEFDLTSCVQEWIATPTTNYGWLVKVVNEGPANQDEFASSDHGTADIRPKLIVSDLPPVITGDINQDGGVDVIDLLYFVDSFGLVAGDTGFDPRCDFNEDEGVDVIDLLTFVDNWPKD